MVGEIYFVGGLLAFVKESEENKEKATEMFRYFDCIDNIEEDKICGKEYVKDIRGNKDE